MGLEARPLTRKQAIFIREYLVDFNGSRAAIAAGYSEKTATVIANENLSKPYIADAIREALQGRQQALQWRSEDILRDLQQIAQDRSQRTRDRLKAYELAGKHLGMYREIVEHTGSVAHLDFSEFTTADLRKLIQLEEDEYRVQ